MTDALLAVGLSLAGLGFALVLLGWLGWQAAVSRETNNGRLPHAG